MTGPCSRLNGRRDSATPRRFASASRSVMSAMSVRSTDSKGTVASEWMCCTGWPASTRNVVRSASCRAISVSRLLRNAPSSTAPVNRSGSGML
ncbi:hypothetical protein COSO111634_36845 [Corallococcus soli]